MAIRVSINKQDRKTIRTVGVVPTRVGPDRLSDLRDIDTSDADNNETLVYDEISGKFIAKPIPIINGGTF